MVCDLVIISYVIRCIHGELRLELSMCFRSLVISLVKSIKTVSYADCYFRGLLKEIDSGHEAKQII